MEIILTNDQLAIVAERNTKIKSHEFEAKTEKELRDSFILGILTSNGVSGTVSWEIKDGKLITS